MNQPRGAKRDPDASGPDGAPAAAARRCNRRRLLTITIAFAVPSVAAVLAQARHATAAPEWNLATLMASMRQVRASSARFVETRYLHLLNQAQRSSGRLIYAAPDRLQKDTTEPTPERMTISGDHLTIERAGERTREVSLQEYAELGGLIESVRATLAGDLPALTQHFTASLAGAPDSWILSLVPSQPKLRQLVATIRIRGERNSIREIETLEADGDRTDTVVTPETK